MNTGLTLGKIAGIRITIDWSWLFIFLLVTWNLAAGVFPEVHPEWGTAMNLTVGIVASLLFFLSVLAHELAHSLVAKARGMPVHNITLFLFGGVSNIEREPPSPWDEFTMAIVGPLTSLVLGILFWVIGSGTVLGLEFSDPFRTLSALNPVSTLLLWLGPVNIILGLFNLIPGFPLDGGRVLRSILWGTTHSLRRATRWAAAVGQGIGWLFIVGGIAMTFGLQLPFFGSGVVAGLWLAFIGWFLNNAASQSYQQLVVHDLLEGIPVERLMRSNAPTVPPNIPVSTLVHDYILGTDEHSFPVLDNGRLLGLVCMEDVRQIPRDDWAVTPVTRIMTPVDRLEIVAPREEANVALTRLSRKDVNQMPVVQDGRLVGMLRRRDILRWLQLQSESATR